jgi:tetratricopeptide (TPR) repeat protein
MSIPSARHLRSIKYFLVIIIACGLYAAISSQPFNRSATISVRAQSYRTQEGGTPRAAPRFDALVRDDFFAGMMGDMARLERGMKFCEEILAANPKHADALVWHGGGLLARAAQAYAKGDTSAGDSLWNRGLKEMNDAVAFEPDNMGVKIGRSATLIGLAQSGWDSSDAEGRALLLSALKDYEKVYQWQKPFFRKLSMHSRGELLFGLASGWSILGERKKALKYLRLIIEEGKGTKYEREAQRWLNITPLPVVQHDCTGCHIQSD